MKKGVVFLWLVLVLALPMSSAQIGFDVGNVLMKVSVKEGDSVTKSLTVTSLEDGDFSLSVIGVEGVRVVERDFFLAERQSNEVEVVFDSSGLEPGVYVGNIEINGGGDITKVPVIFEVESRDVFFDANLEVPPAYQEIMAGSRVVAQVRIFDLAAGGGIQEGLGAVPVDLEYRVFSIDGNVISSESERIIVEERAQISKSFSFPAEIEGGDYVIAVEVNYQSSRGVSSQTFSIKGSPNEETGFLPSLDFEGLGGNAAYLIILLLVVILFFAIIFMFIYMIKDRDKLLLELRRYNYMELDRQRKMLLEQERLLRTRRTASGKVKKEIEEKVKKLKKKQDDRMNELRKLKEEGDVKTMRQKLREWKGEGFNTLVMDYKLKDLTKKEMNDLLKKWNAEYSTGKYKKEK